LKEQIGTTGGVTTEANVVKELMKIYNTALLRLQTCSKFSLDAAQEEEL